MQKNIKVVTVNFKLIYTPKELYLKKTELVKHILSVVHRTVRWSTVAVCPLWLTCSRDYSRRLIRFKRVFQSCWIRSALTTVPQMRTSLILLQVCSVVYAGKHHYVFHIFSLSVLLYLNAIFSSFDIFFIFLSDSQSAGYLLCHLQP